jgi:prevent-host-death family protein
MKLGLREANQHFSKAIRAVRGGKEVILTERGRPIAIIMPVKEEQSEESALKTLADEGLITLPSRRGLTPTPRWKPVSVKGKPLSHTIVEDREDRA